MIARDRLGERQFLRVAGFHPVADMGDRKFVSRVERPFLDPLPVDPNAIGAAKVPDDDIVVLLVLHHAAMAPGDPNRVKPCIALRMPTDDEHRPIEDNV